MANGNAIDLQLARDNDLDWLCGVVTQLAHEDGHAIDERLRDILLELMSRPDYGAVFIVRSAGERAGYAILCHGYSVEYGGRDTILDEIYIAPAHRGNGRGTAALDALERWAIDNGFLAMHLEVMADNPARRLYERNGYLDRGSRFLSKRLGNS